MTDILFYHLSRSPLERALPELLEKSLERGWRAVVRGNDPARLEWLDRKLWLGGGSFLPHGLAGGRHDALQPVLLTSETSAANRPDILFVVDDAAVTPDEIPAFQRVCVVFDGNNVASLEHARGQWKSLTEAAFAAKYWSESDGRWQMKASKNT
ncbi:MAG: DNA polymerase III subunit chi [Rhodobacteraceae bacterium]|nr:DNA polymerase III subunit chi [Paracoccaceae bacterium]